MYSIEDKIQHFEGHLVRIKTSDGFEILDYYNCHETKQSIQLSANSYVIKVENIEKINFVKDDFHGVYSDKNYDSLIVSKYDH